MGPPIVEIDVMSAAAMGNDVVGRAKSNGKMSEPTAADETASRVGDDN